MSIDKKMPDSPIHFSCGIRMKNRFMLAPLTNQQSHENGQLSDEELYWLKLRAKGQFGLVMTCATYVQENGKGFAGQLGISDDFHIPSHQRLTQQLRAQDAIAVIQLYHGGMRSPENLIQQVPICPSKNEEYGARALTLNEIQEVKTNFVQAAIRAQKCGYHGVELHAAHGYLICQFLSKEINIRNDQYGGTLENRARLLFEIIDEVRLHCGASFLLGVRLSPERYGMDVQEVKTICQRLIDQNKIDFIDLSLWDSFKLAEDKKYQNCSLLDHFTTLDFKEVLLTVAGKIRNGEDVHNILATNVDFVTIGQSAILHYDFPTKVIENSDFKAVETPVSRAYLHSQGVSDKFVEYLKRRKGFVADDS